jgi:hypothetical protein
LIAQAILFPAVRTLPGNSVTGHAPLVFFQAVLTQRKAASAVPAKGEIFLTAMANLICGFISFFPICHFHRSPLGGPKGRFSDGLLFKTNNGKGTPDFPKIFNSTGRKCQSYRKDGPECKKRKPYILLTVRPISIGRIMRFAD